MAVAIKAEIGDSGAARVVFAAPQTMYGASVAAARGGFGILEQSRAAAGEQWGGEMRAAVFMDAKSSSAWRGGACLLPHDEPAVTRLRRSGFTRVARRHFPERRSFMDIE